PPLPGVSVGVAAAGVVVPVAVADAIPVVVGVPVPLLAPEAALLHAANANTSAKASRAPMRGCLIHHPTTLRHVRAGYSCADTILVPPKCSMRISHFGSSREDMR